MNDLSIAQKLLVLILLTMAGCIAANRTPESYVLTAQQQITAHTAAQCDKLFVVGAVSVAIGIAAFLVGQTKATIITGFGVALSTIGLVVSMFLSAIETYKNYFVAAFVVLSIIGLFIFVHAVGDVNRDGKIDWQDIKFVFTKLKRKPPTT
jgi:hypothetical protein